MKYQLRIRLLVILMSVALIGLIIIQGNWIIRSLEAKFAEFNRSVMLALQESTKQYERQRFTSSLSDVVELIPNPEAPLIVINSDTFEVPKPLESIQKENNLQNIEQINETDSEIDQLLFNQNLNGISNLVNRLIQQVSLPEVYSSDSVDIDLLNQIMRRNLNRQGVFVDYQLAVLFENSNRLIANNLELDSKKMLDSPYNLPLYNQILGDFNPRVFLDFPKREVYLLQSLWILILSGVIFIVIIIYTFYNSIMTIKRQRKISEVRNDFINNMTHEFKTPVSTISLMGEALGDPDFVRNMPEDTLKRYSGIILDQSRKLTSQITRILQIAQMDKGEFKMNKENMDFHDIIDSLQDSYTFRISEENGALSIQKRAERTEVFGDMVHLSQVIDNLLDNAIKYKREEPNVTIETYNRGDFLFIEVNDNGIGMTKEHVQKIFDRFYRVPTGKVHNVKGFGLGLSFVKTIIEMHDGIIQVNSTPNQGTQFIIRLNLV